MENPYFKPNMTMTRPQNGGFQPNFNVMPPMQFDGAAPAPQPTAPGPAQQPGPAQPQNGAPGSSMYYQPPKSFQQDSGLDPYGPIKAAAQDQSKAAQYDLEAEQAMQNPISLKRQIGGALFGAAAGAVMGPEKGGAMGANIINAPRTVPAGLAAKRAEAARASSKANIETAGAVDKARGGYQADVNSQREGFKVNSDTAQKEADRAQENQEMLPPTDVDGNMVQAPKHANGPAVRNLGPAKPDTSKVEYKIDAQGNLHAMVQTGTKIEDRVIPGIKMDPANKQAFDVFITAFRKQNPSAKPQQEMDAVLKFNDSMRPNSGLETAEHKEALAKTQGTQVQSIITEMHARYPEIAQAQKAGDYNKYMALVEQKLTKLHPDDQQYADAVRDAMRQAAPKQAPKNNTNAYDLLKSITTPAPAPVK